MTQNGTARRSLGVDWSATAQALNSVKQERKKMIEKEKQLEKTLRQLSGYETAHDEEFVYKKEVIKGLPDYQAIVKTFGVDVEQFRKEERDRWILIQI